MPYTLRELAERTDCTLEGDPDTAIARAASAAMASPDAIVFALDDRRLVEAASSMAAAVLAPLGGAGSSKPTLRAKNVRLAWAKILEILYPAEVLPGSIHPSSVIDPTAMVASSSVVGPLCMIGPRAIVGESCVLGAGVIIEDDAAVGNGSTLHARVVVGRRCVLGERNLLFAGAVVGADGFGLARDGERYRRIPHIGIVRTGNDVEIGANSTVDRAALDETKIGNGVKIDNLVQVGHNVIIGENTVIAAGSAIGGSTVIGPSVIMAGQTGIGDHITVGRGVVLLSQAGLVSNAEDGAVLSGWPARPHRGYLRSLAMLRKLPGLTRRMELFLEKQEPSHPEENLAQRDRTS